MEVLLQIVPLMVYHGLFSTLVKPAVSAGSRFNNHPRYSNKRAAMIIY